jgi:hypothetical protein
MLWRGASAVHIEQFHESKVIRGKGSHDDETFMGSSYRFAGKDGAPSSKATRNAGSQRRPIGL